MTQRLQHAFLDINLCMQNKHHAFFSGKELLKKLHVMKQLIEVLQQPTSASYIVPFFIEKNYDELCEVASKFKSVLEEKEQQYEECAILYRDIYANVLQVHTHPKIDIATIFEEFVKGITYFQGQRNTYTNSEPMHIRLAQKILPNQYVPKKTRDPFVRRGRKRLMIERQYIERLIYTALYKYILQHEYKSLNETLVQKDSQYHYQLCFPGCDVQVQLSNFMGWYPTQVSITKTYKGQRVWTQIFKKELQESLDKNQRSVYKPIVLGTMSIVTKKSVTKEKFQSFWQEKKWRKSCEGEGEGESFDQES